MADEVKKSVAVGAPRRHSRADKEMDYVLERFLDAHPGHKGAHDPGEVATWAYSKGIWKPKPVNPVDQLRRRLSKSFGRRYIVDPQGREVKELHAVPYEVMTKDGPKRRFKYYPLFDTDAEEILLAFQLRRGWALNDVVQIETDRLSYNDNNTVGGHIDQMSFDYDKDVAEKNMPTTYPDAPPEYQDDDEDDEEPS